MTSRAIRIAGEENVVRWGKRVVRSDLSGVL